jgi:hypothetical protein
VSKCERDGMEVMPSFYTDRERRRGRGKGPAAAAHLPLMAGGLCGRQEKGKRKEIGGGGGRGD